MPPTPPVPVVTITTAPATPVDMSLETGEDTRLEMAFSDELSYDEFGQNARFTYMYNGVLHANVSAVLHGGDWRIVGDEETIIDVLHWEGTSRHGTTALIIGRHDWKLIAITYGEDYQLKPQDLIGLAITDSTSPNKIVDQLISGVEVPFTFNGYLITAMLDTLTHNAHLKICKCNPDENSKAASYELDFVSSNGIITSYSCSAFDGSILANDLKDFLVDNVGFQPQQVTAGVFDGYLTDTPIPLGFYEL